jgi:uncharacterized membrane protein
MRWLIAFSVGLLALVGVSASVEHLFDDEHYNPGFYEYPLTTVLHVILGGVYLLLAPLQFVQRIRSRSIGYHRWAGRLLVTIGLVVGATALVIAVAIPFSGWWESVVVGGFAGLFLVSLVKSIAHIRAGQVELHREWMIRAFAIGLAIATQRLILIPSIILSGEPSLELARTLAIVSFLVAFVLHSAVAELWIRRTRDRATAGLSGSAMHSNLTNAGLTPDGGGPAVQ